jgi:AcrR family transcriptional regulator
MLLRIRMGISARNSPRETRKRRELEQRRADVVAAALKVFAAKGFNGAQMAEIAAAAELSLASLYGVFEGKEEIYQEVVSAAAVAIRATVEARVEEIPKPKEQLLCLIDALFETFEENRDALRIVISGSLGLPWKIRQAMGPSQELYQGFQHWVFNLTRQAKKRGCLKGVDPETFSLCLIGAATTTAAHWIEARPQRSLADAAPPLRKLFGTLIDSGRE